jgi:hypothetical protein
MYSIFFLIFSDLVSIVNYQYVIFYIKHCCKIVMKSVSFLLLELHLDILTVAFHTLLQIKICLLPVLSWSMVRRLGLLTVLWWNPVILLRRSSLLESCTCMKTRLVQSVCMVIGFGKNLRNNRN